MTTQDTEQIGKVIRANRFWFQSEGIRKLADLFEATVPAFDRNVWFGQIDGNPNQPRTGQRCHCKPGQHRNNCSDCEGTGWRIDFAAIRARAQ